MDINYLIDHFNDDAGHKEEVALIIYYIENRSENEIEGVKQVEVKNVIRNSRSRVSTSSVSTYFSRLDDAGWISEANGDRYILTHDGEDDVEELLADGALNTPRNKHERFIDSEIFEEDRYQNLVGDVNESYRQHIYDGTMVLTRKFFENLIFEILRGEYSGKDTQMFFDQENQRHYSFDELLNNLKIGVPDLKRFTKEGLDREMVEDIRDLKEKGNKGAHSIRVEFEEGEVEALSDDATQLAEVIYEVWKGVQNSNGSSE
ncbi:hypothetical protein [Halorubrum sp. AJ67]|uniref:hypothetical protein n=1 Tax=Halorubrum sp. AJ67 TaxID=1173487 RepID=UPI0003DC9ABC|nr:hypothetical protein [Halorubrum sp. AJ67]CDK38404.1 uncharacterized protein BN903_79 [Halorubrum sp. AJ67]